MPPVGFDTETRLAMQYVIHRLARAYSPARGDLAAYMATGLALCFLRPLGYAYRTAGVRETLLRQVEGRTAEDLATQSEVGASGFAALQGSVEEGMGGISATGGLAGTALRSLDEALEAYAPGCCRDVDAPVSRRVDIPLSERTVSHLVAEELIRQYRPGFGNMQRYLRHGLLSVAYEGFGVQAEGGNPYANAARFVAERCTGTPEQVLASLLADDSAATEMLEFVLAGRHYVPRSMEAASGDPAADAKAMVRKYVLSLLSSAADRDTDSSPDRSADVRPLG